MGDPISAMYVISFVTAGMGMMNKPEHPEVAEEAPPPVTKEDPNVKQAALQYKKRLSNSSRSAARKDIVSRDTLAKKSKLGY